MESNIYRPYIAINRLHVATGCCKAIKRLGQIRRCYMAKSEFPRFADGLSGHGERANFAYISSFQGAISILDLLPSHLPFNHVLRIPLTSVSESTF